MDERIQRFPWQVGPFGCNPGDFWLVGDGPLALYALRELHRFLMIEIQENDSGELIEFLCSTDDLDKGRVAMANVERLRRSIDTSSRRPPDHDHLWHRVKRIPNSMLRSEDVRDRLKGPLSKAGPGQDWYAEIDTSALTNNPEDEPLHVANVSQID